MRFSPPGRTKPIPPQRQAIEEQRRAAKKEAETKVIGVGDLNVKK